MMSKGDRQRRVEAICHAALECDAEERPAAVQRLCGEDDALRREVESWMSKAVALDRFLDQPVEAMAAHVFEDGSSLERPTLALGRRFGSCEILSVLGAGGMGMVYRARDHELGRDVALKVLLPAIAGDPDRLARFEREARVLASLNHPNIAQIHSLEESEGVKALVLELVDGSTIADRLVKGALPVDEVLRIGTQIAEALEAAHARGIVHRDLKPANINLRPDGSVKVLDFGLATALGGDVNGGVPEGLMDLPTITHALGTSVAGVRLGTAAYMSPEQAQGKLVDKRTDIWSFGAVLYEMLTARRAFNGDDVSLTLASVMRSEPDWSALPHDVPARLRTVLTRCLRKDARHRLHDMADVRLLMNGELDTVEPVARVTPRPVLWSALSAALAAAVTAATAWALWPGSSASPLVTRSVFYLPDGHDFGARRHAVAMSPDGTRIAYVANARLYQRSIAELDAHEIQGTAAPSGLTLNNVNSPVFSSDGQSILFWQGDAGIDAPGEGVLKRVATTGGAAVTICQALNPFGVSWTDNEILFGQPTGIWRVSSGGGAPELLVPINEGEQPLSPQRLPDGSVLFSLATGFGADRWDNARIVVQQGRSGRRMVVHEGGSDARYLPTGHLLYAVGRVVFAAPFDLSQLRVTGEPEPVVEGVRRSDTRGRYWPGTAQFAVARAGSLVHIPDAASPTTVQRDLALFDRKGGVHRLGLPPRQYVAPRISRDGRYLAVGTDEGAEAHVWIYGLSGTSAARRLTVGGMNRLPVWSADGGKVAFQSNVEGDLGIFWQRADGSGVAERLTRPEPGSSHEPESWSPDGERLLFRVMKPRDVTLWTLSLKDKRVEPFGDVRSLNEPNAAFSPDGRWVAYFANESGKPSLSVQPFPATGARFAIASQATEGLEQGWAHHPVWSPDGTELLYTPFQDRLLARSISTRSGFEFGEPRQIPIGPLFLEQPAFPRSFDMMPDGRILGLIDVTAPGQPSPGPSMRPQLHITVNWLEELKRVVPVK